MTAAPRQAATVLLLRDGDPGLEVYLLRRTKGMPFAGGMTAYPGGGVDPRDGDTETAWAGPTPDRWAAAFGCDERTARELVCAAVRETFEEAGVLLAGAGDGSVVPDVSGGDWEEQRQALLSRELSLSELLRGRGLALRSDLLRPFAHWITPCRGGWGGGAGRWGRPCCGRSRTVSPRRSSRGVTTPSSSPLRCRAGRRRGTSPARPTRPRG